MIIYGHRTRESKAGTGNFECPNCRTNQSYTRLELRSWFTLYFIPVIPLMRQGTQVQCGGCMSRYDAEILNVVPQQETVPQQSVFGQNDGYAASANALFEPNPYAHTQPSQQTQPNQQTHPISTSSYAIVALVLVCLSPVLMFVCGLSLISSILAVIFGHVALSQIKNSQGSIGGRGMALGSTIGGYLFLGLSVLLIFVIFSDVGRGRNQRAIAQNQDLFPQRNPDPTAQRNPNFVPPPQEIPDFRGNITSSQSNDQSGAAQRNNRTPDAWLDQAFPSRAASARPGSLPSTTRSAAADFGRSTGEPPNFSRPNFRPPNFDLPSGPPSHFAPSMDPLQAMEIPPPYVPPAMANSGRSFPNPVPSAGTPPTSIASVPRDSLNPARSRSTGQSSSRTRPATRPRRGETDPNLVPIDIVQSFPEMGWGVKSLAFSPDGRWLAAGKQDDTILLLDVQNGQTLSEKTKVRDVGQVTNISFVPRGNGIIVAGYRGTLATIPVNKQGVMGELKFLSPHSRPVESLTVSPSANFVISGANGEVVWQSYAGNTTQSRRAKALDRKVMAIYLPKKSLHALATDGKELVSIDLGSTKVSNPKTWKGPYPQSCNFSPDGSLLAISGGSDISIIETASGTVRSTMKGPNNVQWKALFHPDGDKVFTGNRGVVTYWDLSDNSVIANFDFDSIGYIQTMAVSDDGKMLAAVASGAGKTLNVIRLPEN
ncbi:DUF4190 domain-containing protein [Planctomycetes bacterium K23_9]|uniref:WD domain, G-beta repeat n=1 Tax=Stieleria marina TaxID=1930275 RepID=A0A517P344_9BACT|nr:WD domain, G-beta repeat [Planctomycetes bacterium K23_9]